MGKKTMDKPDFFKDLRKLMNSDIQYYSVVLHYERGYLTLAEALKELSKPVKTLVFDNDGHEE